MIRFITGFWSMHDGPIREFTFSSIYTCGCLEVDRWLPFICQKDVRELNFEFRHPFRAPPSMFWCKNLTRLELHNCVLIPPPSFGGFSCMKHLALLDVSIDCKDVEHLISSCVLLKSLKWLYNGRSKLTVRAPNLKCLDFQAELIDICVENAPLLADTKVSERHIKLKESDFDNDSFSSYILERSLGRIPKLERLCAEIGFTRCLSAGSGHCKFITYDFLKHIEFSLVNFADPKEVLVAFQLIFSSPNLQELCIDGHARRFHWLYEIKDSVLDYFKDPFFAGRELNRLKLVKITGDATVPICMKLIEFLLDCSPSLVTMSIEQSHAKPMDSEEMRTTLLKLLSFRRASPKALISFIDS